MARTLAIHWAQTTHGTWLHGDLRGSWQNGRLIGSDPFREATARASMTDDAVRLSATECRMVAAEFGAIVREQQHRVLAATIQSTHVHLVFSPLSEDITTVIARLKYRSASSVLRHRRELATARPAETAGLFATPAETAALYSRAVSARRVPKSIWTAGQFPVFIFNDLHLGNAIEYVRDHNRRIGLPPDPFDWIESLYAASDGIGERFHPGDVTEVLPW